MFGWKGERWVDGIGNVLLMAKGRPRYGGGIKIGGGSGGGSRG